MTAKAGCRSACSRPGREGQHRHLYGDSHCTAEEWGRQKWRGKVNLGRSGLALQVFDAYQQLQRGNKASSVFYDTTHSFPTIIDNYSLVRSPILETQCFHAFLTNPIKASEDFFSVSYLTLSLVTNGRESRSASKDSRDI